MVNKNIIDVQNAKFIVTNNQFFGIDCTNPRAKLQIGDGPELSTNPILLQVADTLAVVKEGNKKKVGIGKYPEEDLDIDGNIQISSSGQEKITFFDTAHQHEHGKLLFTDDQNGSQFEVFTKNATTSNVEQTFTINNKGAIGIKDLSTNPNFGTDGQFLISKGTDQSVDWITLQGGTGVNISPSDVISIGQDVSTTANVLFNTISIGGPIPSPFGAGPGGAFIHNSNLSIINSTISIGFTGEKGTPGQTLTSGGTNSMYWSDKNLNVIWTPYFEPFGLANIGGLVTMDNQTAYYSSFYTSSALSYDKIILYTTESTVSFTGHIGVGIFDSNNSTVGTNKLQEAIVEYTNTLSSGKEILINFPSSVTLDSNTKYWVGIAVDSTNSLGIAKAASVDTDNIHIRKEVSANFNSSGFGSVVSTTNSDLNFWYRLYNSQITSFNDFSDRPDSLSIFKTNFNLLEAKIETETDVSGTGSAILFKTLDPSNVLTEKLRINHIGAIGLRGANYGNVGDVITNDANGLPTWAAGGYGFNELGNASTNVGAITVGNKEILLNEASQIARAVGGPSQIAAISDIPIIPTIPPTAYHCVTIQQNYHQGGVRNMTGFYNRITPVNISSNSSQPFIIPQDGGGTYVIGYGMTLFGNFKSYTIVRTLINGVDSNQRLWFHVDRQLQETELTPARTHMEHLNGGDIITFTTQIQGAGGLEYFYGMAWIMRIA